MILYRIFLGSNNKYLLLITNRDDNKNDAHVGM